MQTIPGHRSADEGAEGAAPLDPPVILTRPQDASARFAQSLTGWTGPIVVSPLLEIRPVTPPGPLPQGAALILTSQNALKHYPGPFGTEAGPLRTFCVGPATTQAARARGLAAEMVAEDARGLIEALPSLTPPQPLVHLRGSHIAQPVCAALQAQGLTCLEWQVYAQEARPLSQEACTVLSDLAHRGRFAILPVFSPRSAHLLAEALETHGLAGPVVAVALSTAVAKALSPTLAQTHVLISEAPNAAAMRSALHAAARHVHKLEGKNVLP